MARHAPYQPPKHDTTKTIILALRRAGASVAEIFPFGESAPILLVGIHGANLLMRVGYQVKDARLVDSDWRGQIITATTEDQALAAIDDVNCRELEY